jgi:phosphoribosyl 1,2-cyclic phosphate phosphodiesterase
MMIGDIRVRSVAQPHGTIYSAGLRFDHGGRSIGYSTDFHDVTNEMRELFSGVDLWIVDALRVRPHPTHAHLDLTLAAIRDCVPGRAVLTHMDQSMDYASLAASLPGSVEPGHDGMELSL